VQWFHGLGLSNDEISERLKHCRHKAQFEPASTPGHFWSVNFPTTQQCKEQGMLSSFYAIWQFATFVHICMNKQTGNKIK